MEHPLTNVQFMEQCTVCGGAYPVTLYDIYREQQLADEWQSARSCGACDEHMQRLVAAVPKAELAAVIQAWEQLAAALQARGLAFAVSSPVVAGDVAQQGPGRRGR